MPVAVIPMGYHPSFGRLVCEPRDIDVVFLGSTRDSRRKRIVSTLQNQFEQTGIKFVLKDGSPQHGYVWGDERAQLLNRTKIVLNIMRQPWDDPVFRMLLTAPNGAMLLSEPVRDAGPFKAGQHFVETEMSNLLDAIRYYLKSEREREEIANRAYELVTCQLTMENMAQKILEEWQARLAVMEKR